MTEADIYIFLTEVFHDVFMRDDLILSPKLSAKEVEGWDSIKQVEIIIATEERFGIKLTTRELDRLSSVGDLVGLVEEKLAAAGVRIDNKSTS